MHTAPKGRMQAAREMGVTYRTDCGIWKWPPPSPVVIRTRSDLHPTETCRQCERVMAARQKWGD